MAAVANGQAAAIVGGQGDSPLSHAWFRGKGISMSATMSCRGINMSSEVNLEVVCRGYWCGQDLQDFGVYVISNAGDPLEITHCLGERQLDELVAAYYEEQRDVDQDTRDAMHESE